MMYPEKSGVSRFFLCAFFRRKKQSKERQKLVNILFETSDINKSHI